MRDDKLEKINAVVAAYFSEHTTTDWIPANQLMPDFIKAGIFTKDLKNGLPLRKLLRELDKLEKLSSIPCLHAERKLKNTYWYFVREGATYVSTEPNDTGASKKEKRKKARTNSDEWYIIDLCDEVLNLKASRQHTFDFLLGDFHKDGVTKTPLPVDAFYKELNLVVEYFEKQHTEPVEIVDQPERMTVSGVNRAEQRKLYDQRKRDKFKEKKINFIEVHYSSFECDSQKKLLRNKEKDLATLTPLLKDLVY